MHQRVVLHLHDVGGVALLPSLALQGVEAHDGVLADRLHRGDLHRRSITVTDHAVPVGVGEEGSQIYGIAGDRCGHLKAP